MKVLIAILLQLPLIVLTKDLALSATNDRDNKTQIELATTAGAKQLNSFESTTPPAGNGNSTILAVDKSATTKANETLTTHAPSTTTEELLIPPATVEAQIVKANISSKKPSRLQAAA
jgi:hypothetical protein